MKRLALLLAAGCGIAVPAAAHDHERNGPAPCPVNGISLGTDALTCTCAPPDTMAGAIYGTDRYTADSWMCLAAVHARMIDQAGGEVTVYGGDGCKRFESTTRNGVSSQAWGPFGLSFWFTGYTAPKCPESKRF